MHPCRQVKKNFGGKGSARVLEANTGVVVCTIEKANSLINRMLEEHCLSSLSCVMVDELHMVSKLCSSWVLSMCCAHVAGFEKTTSLINYMLEGRCL